MAIAQVQKTSNTSAADTVTATLGANPIFGSVQIAACMSVGANASTITGFTAIANAGFGTASRRIRLFTRITVAGDSASIVANSTSATAMELAVFEYTGLLIGLPVDQTVTDGLDVGTTVTSRTTGTTGTTTQPNELAIGVIGVSNSITANTWTNSFNAEIDTVRLHVASRILTTTGTVESTMSWTTLRAAGGIMVTLKGGLALPFPPSRSRRVLQRS